MIRSTCFGYHYVHYQELETIQTFTACGSCEYLYSLKLLMMDIMLPETC